MALTIQMRFIGKKESPKSEAAGRSLKLKPVVF